MTAVLPDSPLVVELGRRRPARPPGGSLLFHPAGGGVLPYLAWEVAARLGRRGPGPAVVMVDSNTRPDRVSPAELERAVSAVPTHVVPGPGPAAPRLRQTVAAHCRAVAGHVVRTRYGGPALLLACGREDPVERLGDWPALGARLRTARLPGGHFDVFGPAALTGPGGRDRPVRHRPSRGRR